MFDARREEPRERLDVPVGREERRCYSIVVVGHVAIPCELDGGQSQRPQCCRERDEARAVVPVSKGMHAQDARIHSACHAGLLKNTGVPLPELLNADHVIANGEPEQAKALLAILIADLRVNSRAEVLPTYRIGAPVVCAQTSSVELVGLEPTTSTVPR